MNQIHNSTEPFPHRSPELAKRDGYLYMVELENGTVKVGRTTNPFVRMRNHSRIAAKLGVPVLRWWVSEPHRGVEISEARLIAEATSRATEVGGKEYMRGVRMDDLIAFVGTLGLRPSTPAEAAEDEARDDAKFEGSPFRRMLQDSLDELEARAAREAEEAARTVVLDSESVAAVLRIASDRSRPLPEAGFVLEGEQSAGILERLMDIADERDMDFGELLEWSLTDWIEDLLRRGAEVTAKSFRHRVLEENPALAFKPFYQLKQNDA